MVTSTAGAVILVPFPFSDLSRAKLRPAVVLASAEKDDWILCQVTSNPYKDKRAIELTDDAFQRGSLKRISYARPAKLFTANVSLFHSEAGLLKSETLEDIINSVVGVLKGKPIS
ncbi:type II toxin-antitoxin system PemK/MazF family toxin [bacterium]|nr:type II toxin-antitoxin system PemK/MazF family toxin [bacterium]